MPTPVVNNLADIMAQLEGAYAPQRQLFQQQINELPGQLQQQNQALDVAKTNAFTDVNTNANSKGLAFSGIPAAEQTRYLGEKYLPAKAAAAQSINTQRTTLQQQLAALFQDQSTRALSTQQSQESTLQQFLADQEKMRFQAQESELQRQFEGGQNAANRAASSAGNAGPTPQQMFKADVGALHGELSKVTGRDGFVSPTSYAQAKSLWISNGYSSKDFDTQFGSFRNPKNKAYKLG